MTFVIVALYDELIAGMRAILASSRAYTRLDIAFHDAILLAVRNRLLKTQEFSC